MSGIFLLLSSFFISGTKADSCQGIKDDIVKIQRHQYAIKNEGDSLADLEKKFDMANARFILLEGLIELKKEYLSFLEQSKDASIDMNNSHNHIVKDLKEIQDDLTKGVNAAVRLSTVYNFLKNIDALGDSDVSGIKTKCFDKMSTDFPYDGKKTMKHLCQKIQGDDSDTVETLNGFIAAYNQANDETLPQIMMDYVNNSGDKFETLLDGDTIGLLEGTRGGIEAALKEYKECTFSKKPNCHKHFLIVQSSLEKIRNLTKDMDETFHKEIFHAFLDGQFGRIETIDESIKSYLTQNNSSNLVQKRSGILGKVRQNYNLAKEKERIRREMLGLDEETSPPFDIGNLYTSLFDELREKKSSPSEDQDIEKDFWEDKDFILKKSDKYFKDDKSQFNLTMLSAFLDKMIDLESSVLERKHEQIKSELSDLAKKIDSIKKSEKYTQYEREKSVLISRIEESCREIRIIKSRPCHIYPMEVGILEEKGILWNFIDHNDEIVGEINVKRPSSETSSPIDGICEKPSEALKDSFTCGYNEYRKKQAYTVQLQNEINRNFYDNHYVGHDAQGRPVNYGKRRAFYEDPGVLGSGVGLGVSLIQLYHQGENWRQNKEPIMNQYKSLKTHSWWQRQKCVNIFVYREYLCTSQGYSYNGGFNPSFGLWPPNAQNFCLECR